MAGLLHFGCTPTVCHGDGATDFSRDVRPILSDRCFKCHGPDEGAREAELRLDTREGATADLGGYSAVAPLDPDASELLVRISSEDESLRMPPVDSGLSITSEEADVLRRWISEGAPFEVHWSLQPVKKPKPPVADSPWPQNEIDSFIYARLEQSGLAPSPEARRATLIRRVYLDVLGLPPTIEQIEQFLRDDSPEAYAAMVDRALASPHYGERWGRHWLDQARYADTNGYTIDSARPIWPYRDWVIRALNADMPFDQFTIEQLAGDLLPNPSRDVLIATGFHRNTLVNEEGGADPEQFRNEAVVDRVSTTGSVWLGLTLACAQCHTHKFDPVSQHDFYRFFAFFNNSEDVNSVDPKLPLPTPDQEARLAELNRQIAEAKAAAKPAAAAAQDAATPEPTPLELERQQLAASLQRTMVMRELPEARETFVHLRGDFLRHGDRVEPDVPAVLPPLPDAPGPRTRLDLARWLVNRRNPLTARVTVNRVWARYFGQGLVETENDFGLQGTPPTHPELLDWLAAEFMDGGWSLKRLHRTILTSAVYRQASDRRPELDAVDPYNKLLGRQARLRVEAETVRDLALAASGLLSPRIGGPSVYPPQPAGVYSFTQQSETAWPTSTGPERYRRGLYTFFMRSAPYPMLTTFDAPAFNATCTMRRRSDTPLQSLTVANDEALVECARALGRRLRSHAPGAEERISYAFLLCLGRAPRPEELQRLLSYAQEQQASFAATPEEAAEFAGQPADASDAEAATWTAVARVMLNLDEFITRE